MILSVAALASFATAATAGAPKVSGVWARTSTEMMGASYLTIQGTGTADKLVAAAAPKSLVKTTELHRTVMDSGGMMSMKPVKSIAVPASGTVKLKPGGYHVMLIGLKKPGRRRDLPAHAHVRDCGQEDGHRDGAQGLEVRRRTIAFLAVAASAAVTLVAVGVRLATAPGPTEGPGAVAVRQPGRIGRT